MGPRNVVILSDGTGQRGGRTFDEARTNVYKLFRSTRVGPDSTINPDEQIAFYDAGLGTLETEGTAPERIIRLIYNAVSQATGLGLTRNIINCYAALIRLWRPGDRIFLFGFSRGAYTIRCLAAVICLCGIPTSDRGRPLLRDKKTSKRIAARAVKSVYQHVSSPREAKYFEQRKKLAALFRRDHESEGDINNTVPNVYPFFIGVFDTVAALADPASLLILSVVYLVLHSLVAWGLSTQFLPFSFWHWFGWIAVAITLILVASYVYTHLKFSFRLKDYWFWDVIHLTALRQRFYDRTLNPNVKYARHAISIDERRHSFARVPWGSRHTKFTGEHKMRPFKQYWFSGNHADVGGGYDEDESRLSDIALAWMVDEASSEKLGNEALKTDPNVLHLNSRFDGMQHDETRNSIFRWARKTSRILMPNATLHGSVIDRFKLDAVLQYDRMAPYRPESLRQHEMVKGYYGTIAQPRVTCWQRIKTRFARQSIGRKERRARMIDQSTREITLDSAISCVGLFALTVFGFCAAWILVLWQVLPWLLSAQWNSYPLSKFWHVNTGWLGLQQILDWMLSLPVTFVLVLGGILLFWLLGKLSAWAYEHQGEPLKAVTPDQSKA